VKPDLTPTALRRLARALAFACTALFALAAAAPALAQPVLKTTTLIGTLSSPWGMAFLPDGRILVTQRGGSMVILAPDGRSVQGTVSGLPAVSSAGQGGLLDVAIDPDFASNPFIYWTYTEPGTGAEAGLKGTAVARGRLVGNALQGVSVIYRQVPKVSGDGHFGSRLAFRSDRTLYVTLGERQQGSPAQDLTKTLGKTVRIHRDGTVPADNPAIAGARPEIWSYGHRNPQGGAVRPGTDELWLNEHGPEGGDELNRIVPGGNYGWPNVSYGCNYGETNYPACRFGGGVHAPTYVEPVSYWVQESPTGPVPSSIAPAGLLFYTGAGFPEWQGQVFMGALAGTALWRVALSGNTETAREMIRGPSNALNERIRAVSQGPDGWIHALTDSGKLIRVSRDLPAGPPAAQPSSVTFGAQSMNTTAPAQLVTFTNTSASPLTVTGAIVTGPFAALQTCSTVASGDSCRVTVTYTPTAEGPQGGTLTLQTSLGPAAVALTGTGERSLVTHYYRSILRRAPDAGGKAFWEGEMVRLPSLGANVNETWYAMATFFYFSPEYTAFNRDDAGFVTDLYNTFFNRPPDGGGLAFWTGQLAQGMPREVVLVAFMFSNEFQTFTQAIFGNVQARKEVDTVGDFYRGLLSRLPDDGGFNGWVSQFRAAQCAGAGAVYAAVESISAGFANGGEYTARNRTNAQYVGDLYNAFLRRGGDLGGVQYWIGQLDGGVPRNAIRQQFIASPEFSNRVNAIVAEGCVP
jgi:glucose/arabinose dehydrogenase